MSESKAFKDYFDDGLVDDLAGWLTDVAPLFDALTFKDLACDGLVELEMKARVRQIADAMEATLPGTTPQRMGWLIEALPPVRSDHDDTAEPISGGFRLWPFGAFIASTGLDDFTASFDAMVELTQRFTSEFALRPFLAADPVDALDRMERLLDHESHHVRRWVSEGTRSRLPWAKKIDALIDHQERRLAFLAALRHDESRYVQRSVANHLQDILKDDEPRGIQVIRSWASERQESTNWIIRHASRNLLKAGHPDILEVFGYAPGMAKVRSFSASPKVATTGDTISLRAVIENTSDTATTLRVDVAMKAPTKTGKISRKVFRWADRTLAPGETTTLTKSYDLIHRSTRKVYPGTFLFAPIVNGEEGPPASVCVDI